MRMLSDPVHWLSVGLALLLGLGRATDHAIGQAPMMNRDTPNSMSFPGPAPMGCDSTYGCDSYVDSSHGLFGTRGTRGPFGPFGHGHQGAGHYANACGPAGCMPGSMMQGAYADDGLLGTGPLGQGLLGGGPYCQNGCGPMGRCGLFGGMGCAACGAACFGLCGAEGAIFSGRCLSRILGPLAPYSEGAGSQRWFDVYAGTIAMARKSGVGPVTSIIQDIGQTTPVFETTDIISTIGTGNGNPVIRTTDLDLDKIRYGLELVGNIQTGPGSNVEVRYFGLNNWNDTLSVQRNDPELFSIFSDYGTNPGGIPPGFDDTDRSFIHTLSYDSKFDNGEVNYRRRWVGYNSAIQGSWLGGVRYFELDENLGFAAVGSNDDTFTFDQLRFFNMDTKTRNHLVGFQLGADLWVNLIPGIALGSDIRAGIYNNQAKVDTRVVANSVPGATEVLRKESAAFLLEYSAQAVYRLTYSWSIRGAYNLLYVDEVALAPANFNPRDMANGFNNDVFGINRFPFINADGHVFYQGYSVGAEFLW